MLLYISPKIIAASALLFFVTVAFSDNLASLDNEENEDMITCLIENGLDPGTYANMKKDGTFNVETILSNSAFGEEGNRKLDGIVNICKLQAGSDICKLARCYQDLKKSPN